MNKLLLTLVLAGGTLFAANARDFHGHHKPHHRKPELHFRTFVPPPPPRPVVIVPPRPVIVVPPPPRRGLPPPPPPRHHRPPRHGHRR